MSCNSIKDNDPKIAALINWVTINGGICNVEIRRDSTTGLRGLYASLDITDAETPLISIPNHLIVSPLHIQALPAYADIF
jgi:hypothetical protein